MDVLEIIGLRSLKRGHEDIAENLLAEVAGPAAEEGLRLELYRRASVATDLSVHLHRSQDRGGARPSPLGLRLAAALREHGQVSHSVWEKTKTSDASQRRDP